MGSIEQLRNGAEVNLTQLEKDITTTVRSASLLATVALPLRDYEAAAKETESMGVELIGAAKKCEAMTADVHDAIAYMRDTAAAYREDAKKFFKRIEACALFTEDVRKTCEEVKRKMAEGAAN
jgi:hypothetical protein